MTTLVHGAENVAMDNVNSGGSLAQYGHVHVGNFQSSMVYFFFIIDRKGIKKGGGEKVEIALASIHHCCNDNNPQKMLLRGMKNGSCYGS